MLSPLLSFPTLPPPPMWFQSSQYADRYLPTSLPTRASVDYISGRAHGGRGLLATTRQTTISTGGSAWTTRLSSCSRRALLGWRYPR